MHSSDMKSNNGTVSFQTSGSKVNITSANSFDLIPDECSL